MAICSLEKTKRTDEKNAGVLGYVWACGLVLSDGLGVRSATKQVQKINGTGLHGW